MRKHFAAMLWITLIAGLASAAFNPVWLSVNFKVSADGSAHATEEMRLFMDEKASVELYDSGIALRGDITSWKVLTNVPEVRYHVDSSKVTIKNEVIRPQPKDACNPQLGTCYGTLVIEYDVYPIALEGDTKKGTGIVTLEHYKPRTTRYTLNPKSISFEISQTGELVLPEHSQLKISIPADSVITNSEPKPALKEEIGNGAVKEESRIEMGWNGRTTLAGFNLVYVREESLSTEVIEFFQGIERQALSFILSLEGFAFLLVAAVAGVSYVMLKNKK